MLFNSFDFAVFLPVVFILYWFLASGNYKLQNSLIVVASYVFYGWWDQRFLLLIVLSTIVDYIVGINMGRSNNQSQRKVLLLISIVVNLGILGFFKYFNFFIDNIANVATVFGYSMELSLINVILPVGISFYTFQTLSYSIDVYTKKLSPTSDFVAFAAYVSFFPQLVAGPIERATHLLPQFHRERSFNYIAASSGLKQILWGLFKKVVIADNCAILVNEVFKDPNLYNSSTLWLAAVFFAFQIYGDFSGYSDIAIGTAKLFDFDLMRNFAYPYFSRDIAEFWRRWHISLSTWFRDYVYIPLGGSKRGLGIAIVNTFVIFILSGFWHGASWTFICWGLINALYILPLVVLGRNRKNIEIIASNKTLPNIKELFEMVITFILTVIAWIFFRADSVSQAFSFIAKMFSETVLITPEVPVRSLITIAMVIFLLIIEWIGRHDQFGIEKIGLKWTRGFRWSLYYGIVLCIYLFSGKAQQFIYFQF